MTWWRIRKQQDPADDERADTMRDALERLEDLSERANQVLDRDEFAEAVASLFRGERP